MKGATDEGKCGRLLFVLRIVEIRSRTFNDFFPLLQCTSIFDRIYHARNHCHAFIDFINQLEDVSTFDFKNNRLSRNLSVVAMTMYFVNIVTP